MWLPHRARLRVQQLIGRLEPDDVLIVARLDRLARSTRDTPEKLTSLSRLL
jgi:DNA invertase Pin-like site-specific DNA recombinase